MPIDVTLLIQTLETLMDQTVIVKPQTGTVGDSGDEEFTDGTTTTYTDCHVQPLKSESILQFAKEEIHVSHRIYFYQDPGSLEGKILVFDSRNFYPQQGPINYGQRDVLWYVLADEET